MEVTITAENFESLKNGEMPLVVDFWATWCGPCRAIAPYIEELAKEYDGKIVVGKCDVEENDDIVMEYGVRNIPYNPLLQGRRGSRPPGRRTVKVSYPEEVRDPAVMSGKASIH